MRPNVLILCISFLFLSLLSYNQSVTKNEYYQAYNNIKIKELQDSFILVSKIDLSHIYDEYIITKRSLGVSSILLDSSFFSLDDKKFIKKQISHPVIHRWRFGKIRHAQIIKSTELKKIFNRRRNYDGWNVFYKKYGTKGYYKCSIPVFSVRRDKCALYIGNQCGGLCGAGEIYLCERKGDAWVVIHKYLIWIS